MTATHHSLVFGLLLLVGCASRDWNASGTVSDPGAHVPAPSSAGVSVLTQPSVLSAPTTEEGPVPPGQHHHHGAGAPSSGASPGAEHPH
jgi:hypothetical protein